MAERELESVVNPKLASCLRERIKAKKQVEQSETEAQPEEGQSQENTSDAENLPEEEDDQPCVEKIPMKDICPVDNTVHNTILLLGYQRNLEKLISDVHKDLRKRKRDKLSKLSTIKVTEGTLVPTDVSKLIFNEDSADSLFTEMTSTHLIKEPDSDDFGIIESDGSNSSEDVNPEDNDNDDKLVAGLTNCPTWPPCPPLPKLKKVKIKQKGVFPAQEIPKYLSPFSRGKGYVAPEVGHKNSLWLLEKGITTLLVHYGWQDASRQALDVLVDFAEEFLFKLTRLLRTAVDHERETGSAGFPEVLERVLVEMGLGGIEGVVLDYQLRVLNYNKKVYESCVEAMEEYKTLTEATQEDIISELECNIDDEDLDVPEIHFPAGGEGYAVDELQPSLEPGFQMLHSLEQEEQLQNLEAEEHTNMGESLSEESQMSSASVSGTTIKSKRKRKE